MFSVAFFDGRRHTKSRSTLCMHILRKREAGWTLMELLIVMAIIAIIALIYLLVNWKNNIFRAYDARRKTDLSNIRRSFEEYFNDNECYPTMEVLNTCGGPGLAPYLAKIPCDPATKEPYKYAPDSESNMCTGNRVCAKLQDWADPDITTLGCDPKNGCGWGAYWNYCLAAGTTVLAPGFNPAVVPSPLATPTPRFDGPYACVRGDEGGICNFVGNDPAAAGCRRSFADSDCLGLCNLDPSIWCR